MLRSIEVHPWFNDLVTAVYFLSSVEVQLDLVTVVLLSPPVSNIHKKDTCIWDQTMDKSQQHPKDFPGGPPPQY